MRLLQVSKIITIGLLLTLVSCASGRYKVGDCFIWTIPGTSHVTNEVYSVSVGEYHFYRQGYANLQYPDYADIEYVDSHSTKVMCLSTARHKENK
jgi:hypothetical protein